mmetsp:Transcript_3660/g.8493  ORF Transcript_3660/g.8493 Transcript_3660/m.8493 type:complete len:135 (+) Transcript_3660:109-513(+)
MNTYCHGELAQTIFGYELQRRCEAAGKRAQVHVCHPGASKTDLIKDDVSCFTKYLWACLAPCIAQSAERGSYPEVMCATQDGLNSRTFYGPTGRMDFTGPVGECVLLEDLTLDQEVAKKLWAVSEEKTGLSWSP